MVIKKHLGELEEEVGKGFFMQFEEEFEWWGPRNLWKEGCSQVRFKDGAVEGI